jgi:hypothetical protein
MAVTSHECSAPHVLPPMLATLLALSALWHGVAAASSLDNGTRTQSSARFTVKESASPGQLQSADGRFVLRGSTPAPSAAPPVFDTRFRVATLPEDDTCVPGPTLRIFSDGFEAG